MDLLISGSSVVNSTSIELVRIGRYLFNASCSISDDKLQTEIRDIAMKMFESSSSNGDIAGEFCEAFYNIKSIKMNI